MLARKAIRSRMHWCLALGLFVLPSVGYSGKKLIWVRGGHNARVEDAFREKTSKGVTLFGLEKGHSYVAMSSNHGWTFSAHPRMNGLEVDQIIGEIIRGSVVKSTNGNR